MPTKTKPLQVYGFADYNIWEQSLVAKQNRSTNTRANETQSQQLDFKLPGRFLQRPSSSSEYLTFIYAPTDF